MKKIFILTLATSLVSLNSVAASVCDTYFKDIDTYVNMVNNTKAADATAKKSATFSFIKSKKEISAMADSVGKTSKCTTGSTDLANKAAGWKTRYATQGTIDKVNSVTDSINNKLKF